jgi:hypothetical protein
MTTPNRLATSSEATSDAALGELRREILRRVGPILLAAGVATGRTACRLEPEPTQLSVHFEVPVPVSPAMKQALAVRVLDVVRGAGRTYGQVHVFVHVRA